ncbi:DUF1826 domain-containing protein [Acidovorax radicis]|uniref:DUF1826 domain-containing protein n=1 Tax=Acidovorax radicis TaxID=758826 RepID=UPI00215783AA|nr:DUF1826 domain-containing protein [Acidovorax radicis]
MSHWRDPDAQMCWLDRPPQLQICRYLDGAVQEGMLGRGWQIERFREGDAIPLTLLPLLRGRGALMHDIEGLSKLFGDVTGACAVRIRFEVISSVQCPRFHVDNVKARLLCTYRGIGTQWLDERDADRSKLGGGAGGLSDEASGLILHPAAVRTLTPFAIALLKGRQWAGIKERGAIHRSPPMSPMHGPRVLVAIDAL